MANVPRGWWLVGSFVAVGAALLGALLTFWPGDSGVPPWAGRGPVPGAAEVRAVAAAGDGALQRTVPEAAADVQQRPREILVLDGVTRLPVGGVELAFFADAYDEAAWSGLEPRSAWARREGAAATTDATGRAVIHPHPRCQAVHAFDAGRYGRGSLEPPRIDPVVIVLERDLEVSGRVVDAAGRPVPGVRVRLFPAAIDARGQPAPLDYTNKIVETSDATGRVLFAHLQRDLSIRDAGQTELPLLVWDVDWLGEERSGLVPADEPWMIVVPDTAWLAVDLRVPDGEDVAWRLPIGLNGGMGEELVRKRPEPGIELEIVGRPRDVHGLYFKLHDGLTEELRVTAPAAGERATAVIERPWRCSRLSGRLVDGSGHPVGGGAVQLLGVAGGVLDEVEVDEGGCFELVVWMSTEEAEFAPGALAVSMPFVLRSITQWGGRFLPGQHDLGDLVVDFDPSSRTFLAEIQVLGPREAIASATPRPQWFDARRGKWVYDHRAQRSALGGGRFAFHGEQRPSRLRFVAGTARTYGTAVAEIGDRDVELVLEELGWIEVEVLVPGLGFGSALELRFVPERANPVKTSFRQAGVGRVTGAMRVPVDSGRLEVCWGRRVLHEREGIVLEPGAVLRLVADQAIDLRGMFEPFRIELRDAAGRPVARAVELYAWDPTAAWSLQLPYFPAGIATGFVPRSVREVVVLSDGGVPVVRPARGTSIAPFRETRPVDFVFESLVIAENRRAVLEVRVVDDGFPAAPDDPRRDELDLSMPVETCAAGEMAVIYTSDDVLVEARATLVDDSVDPERAAPLFTRRFRIEPGRERYTFAATPDELRSALRALER